jgi:hypothetical protein
MATTLPSLMGSKPWDTAFLESNQTHQVSPFVISSVQLLNWSLLTTYIPNTASKAGLVSFFDFIVGANGDMLMGSGENLDEGEEYDDIDCKLPGFFCFLARAIGMLTALFSSSTSPRQPRKSCWIM